MKLDRKTKAPKSGRRAASKINGKHPLVAYEHIPVGIVETSLEGKYRDVNAEFCRILGYSRNELLQLGIRDCTHEDDYSIDIKLHEQLVAGKIPFYKFEKRFRRKDGSTIWVELTRSLVSNAQGEPLYTVGVVLDISERKDVESVLRQSVERLHLATEAAQMFVWEWDFETQSFTLADNFEKVLGFSAGLLPKNSFETAWALSPKEDVQHIAKEFEKAVEDQSDFHPVPYRVINPENGQVVWLEINAKIVYDSEGKPVRLFGVAQNITETKRAEAALQLARSQAERSADRTARLQKVTAALSEALTPPQVAEVIVRQGARAFGAVSISAMLLSEDGQTLEMMYSTSAESTIRPYRRFPLSLNVPAAEAARSGQPVWIESRQQYLERYPHLADQINQWGQQAAIAIPMAYKGRISGVLTLSFDRVLAHTLEDENYALTLARQGAQALERARAENALRESEERFRTLANAMPSMVWTAAPDGTITYANDQWFRYVGIAPEQNAKGWPELVLHPDDYERCVQDWRRALETVPDEYVIEVRNRRNDGEYRWFQTRAVPARDASGRVTAWYGVTTDIHDRIEAEKRVVLLAEISEMLRNFEDPYEMMYTISKAVGEQLQVKRVLFNEIDLENDREVVHRDYHNGVESVAGMHKISEYSSITSAEMQAGKTVVNVDSKIDPRTAQDYEKTYAVSRERSYVAVPMMRDNRWVASLWVSDDVPRNWSRDEVSLIETIAERTWTVIEKLRINMELRQSEERFRQAANASGALVYEVDLLSGTTAVVYGMERLVGYDPQETAISSDWWHSLIHPDDLPVHLAQLEELLQRGGTDVCEYRLWHKNGEWIIVQDNRLVVHDAEGRSVRLVGAVIEITDRKRAEEALRESEERFARFMQHLPGLAWIKDLDGRYVYANATAEKAFRTPPGKLYGRTDEDIFPAEVASQFRVNDAQALSDEKGIQVIETLEQEDDILHYSLVSKFPIPGPDGSIALIGGIAFDITERRQAEEALRESEERFRAILRQATAGIVRKDAEGRFIFVNQAFCNMLGYTEAELLGKTVWDFMHEEDVAENKRLYHRLMREGVPFNLERRLLREDGSVIWVDASVSPIMDATGKPQSSVSVEVNITRRKQAEEALQQLNLQLEEHVQSRTARLRAVNQTLREEIAERKRVEAALRQSEATARANEKKLSTLFELLPVGISFLDLEGQIIQMNSALTTILRLSKEQLADQGYGSRTYIRSNGTLMPPAEFASHRALAEGKTIYNVETGVLLENSEVIWTSVSAAPVDVADVGAAVVTVDITERKHAERALQESRERLQILSQRLVEVQEDERRAIARELHDRVGQTLAALNINLIIISGQLAGTMDEQISTRLSDSMKLVTETISLVRDVMSNLRPSVLDDYGLEAAIDSYLSQFVARYEIQAKFEKPKPPIPRLGSSIEITFLRITQEALMNVARHARASQVNLSLRREDNAVHLTVQDNGTGIESWQDANRPGSHGLTIMRERAEALGGHLRVSSMPGKGTWIEVSIPVEDDASPQTQKEMH